MSFIQGGHLVAKALKAHGVSHLFTLCGGHIQMIYDGCISEGIRVVDCRHEQSAAHAADGWARATGKAGVAAVTAGPGVTDAVTAVANAARAQVPMLLIGGQGARMMSQFGGQDRGSLQEMDHVDLMRPICKWSVSVPETKRLGEYISRALWVAHSGVPGPVFLEMPLDVIFMGCKEDEVVPYQPQGEPSRPAPDPRGVEAATRILAEAKRPMLVVGSQWRWSPKAEALETFLAKHPIPTFLNGMARGALGEDHPSVFRHCRSKVLAQTDAVVVFGTPLDFRLKYGEAIPASAKVIQVDFQGEEPGRNRQVDVAIQGDTGWVLAELAKALPTLDAAALEDWRQTVVALETQRAARMTAEMEDAQNPIKPLHLFAKLKKHIPKDAILIGDGGDFVATAAYSLSPEGIGSWMDPGPLGTLGVGPGYAMAAKLAHPQRKVVLISGDGTFGLNGFEFEAMARQGIGVICVVGNDGAWTQIRRGQVEMYGVERAVATDLVRTRYDQIAQAMGAKGLHLDDAAKIDAVLSEAFAHDGPVVINVEIGTSDFRKGAISV